MALSLQRTAMILVFTRIIVIGFLSVMAVGGTFADFNDFSSFSERTQEKQGNFMDFLFSNGINIGGTYTDTKIGDEQYGFKMSFSDILMSGLVGIFPTDWATNNFERMFMYILNLFSFVMTLLAGYEIIQVMWGKKTT